MAVHEISRSLRVGEKFAVLAAGTHALDALSGKPLTCIRRLQVLVDCNVSALADPGETASAPGALTAGTVIDADASSITFTGGPVMVFW